MSKSKAQGGHCHKGFLRLEFVDEHQAVKSLQTMSCDVPPKSVGEYLGECSGGYEQMSRKILGQKKGSVSSVNVKHFIRN